jgi:hypothetical protein
MTGRGETYFTDYLKSENHMVQGTEKYYMNEGGWGQQVAKTPRVLDHDV